MKFAEYLKESEYNPLWSTVNRKEITKDEFNDTKSKMEKLSNNVNEKKWDRDGIKGAQYFISNKYNIKTIESQYHSASKQRKYFYFQ